MKIPVLMWHAFDWTLDIRGGRNRVKTPALVCLSLDWTLDIGGGETSENPSAHVACVRLDLGYK